VEGAGLLDEAAGCLGWEGVSARGVHRGCNTYLGDHADNEALLLDAVRLDRVGVLEDLACRSGSASAAASGTLCAREQLTGVDELLLRYLPALLALDLGLEGANLARVLAGGAGCVEEASAYRFRRLSFDDELVLLEVLDAGQHEWRAGEAAQAHLESDLHGGELVVVVVCGWVVGVAGCWMLDGESRRGRKAAGADGRACFMAGPRAGKVREGIEMATGGVLDEQTPAVGTERRRWKANVWLD
jgi:hypothetical protein